MAPPVSRRTVLSARGLAAAAMALFRFSSAIRTTAVEEVHRDALGTA
jgi:hypothetical protein